ncbi:glycoside hydrolase family 2 protein [Alkalibacterium sp.]|nr:MAG: glycoside hydrolase family 2 [Alkalibacterium sp.]
MKQAALVNEVKKVSAPNPQFVRDSWIELDGTWYYAADYDQHQRDEEWVSDFPKQKTMEIPMAYESMEEETLEKQPSILWYQKTIDVPHENRGKKILLNFEAVDYLTTVWINGTKRMSHEGGFDPFQAEYQLQDKEDQLTITLKVEDRQRSDQPLGKQSWKGHNFLCWYTTTTGIWQTVWAEFVSASYLESVEMIPNLDEGNLELAAFSYLKAKPETAYSLEIEITLNGKPVKKIELHELDSYVETDIPVDSDFPDFRVATWSPEQPQLYDIEFTLKENGEAVDKVKSYFGMRSIGVRGKDITLNNEKFYQKLILDQGYYGDTLMTPADADMEYQDLVKIKEMGFNGLRKHQTVATNRFLYLCDKLGLVVWAEMPSSYRFHSKMISRVHTQWQSIVKKHINHPSVITYTVMNESWGTNEIYKDKRQQQFCNSLYTLTKALDNSRLVVGNDGWEHTLTDILTVHDYSQSGETLKEAYRDVDEFANGAPSQTSKKYNYAKGYAYQDQPIMMSEFGGVAYAADTNEEAWGYGNRPQSKEEAFERMEELIKAIMDNDNISGFCYTQLSDVEQEVNGLLTHDHEYKFDPVKMNKLLNYKHTGGFIFE